MDPLLLEAHINHLLGVDQFQDYAPNGLQIEGRSKICRIATAVTASLHVIQNCIQCNVDALLVHHGYFWKGESPSIRGLKKNRLSAILKHDLNIYAYHLPLDVYADWGNNACIAKKLNIRVEKKLARHQVQDILWLGALPQALPAEEFLQQIQHVYGPQVVHIAARKKPLTRVAWCSGAGQDFFDSVATQDIDAYITGEFSERTYHCAKEAGVDFFALGHHASERDGIRYLGEYLADKFSLQHDFIDEDNPF